MSLGGKWIEGIRPEGSVADAARVSLSARLAAVGHWLPLAAADAEKDIEHVHQLRVSTRRAGAALRLYRDWLPQKPYRWLKKRLRTIRRAAGAARDLDVLMERVRHDVGDEREALLGELGAKRAAAQDAIVEVAERSARQEKFASRVRKLLDGICEPSAAEDACGQPIDFRCWARERLAREAAEFLAAEPGDFTDMGALHQFRIAAKKLRYAIELLSAGFSPELRREHYPVVEEVQERLGKINDYVVGARHLRELGGELSCAESRSALELLAERDESRLDDEVKSFREWWTPERARSLQQGIGVDEAPQSLEGS